MNVSEKTNDSWKQLFIRCPKTHLFARATGGFQVLNSVSALPGDLTLRTLVCNGAAVISVWLVRKVWQIVALVVHWCGSTSKVEALCWWMDWKKKGQCAQQTCDDDSIGDEEGSWRRSFFAWSVRVEIAPWGEMHNLCQFWWGESRHIVFTFQKNILTNAMHPLTLSCDMELHPMSCSAMHHLATQWQMHLLSSVTHWSVAEKRQHSDWIWTHHGKFTMAISLLLSQCVFFFMWIQHWPMEQLVCTNETPWSFTLRQEESPIVRPEHKKVTTANTQDEAYQNLKAANRMLTVVHQPRNEFCGTPIERPKNTVTIEKCVGAPFCAILVALVLIKKVQQESQLSFKKTTFLLAHTAASNNS